MIMSSAEAPPHPNPTVITIKSSSFLAPTLPCATQINLAMQLSKHLKIGRCSSTIMANGNMLVLLSAFFLKKKIWVLRFGLCRDCMHCIGMPRRRAPRRSWTLNRRTLVKPACLPVPASPLQRPLLVLYIHTGTHTALVLELQLLVASTAIEARNLQLLPLVQP
jgi:hypothetical protein